MAASSSQPCARAPQGSEDNYNNNNHNNNNKNNTNCELQEQWPQSSFKGLSTLLASALLVLLATALRGCQLGHRHDDDLGAAGGTPSWASSSWSKTYDRVLSEEGFDQLVAGCPGDESSFYDRSAKALSGKYEWYCASRAKYFASSAKQRRPLELTGYRLSSAAPLGGNLGARPYAPGTFARLVGFRTQFYPLEAGECYVDFADAKVGGGVFRSGLAQEEKLMLQLPELLLVIRERSRKHRPLVLTTPTGSKWGSSSSSDVIVFANVVRPAPAVPKSIDLQCGWPPKSALPCANFEAAESGTDAAVTLSVVVAVNAQQFEYDGYYSDGDFDFLANKVFAAFAASQAAGCRALNSGPLGAGVFQGNVHLVTALHAVMAAAFDMPVTLWGMEPAPELLEALLAPKASLKVADLLKKLRSSVAWGHGRNKKKLVEVNEPRWEST